MGRGISTQCFRWVEVEAHLIQVPQGINKCHPMNEQQPLPQLFTASGGHFLLCPFLGWWW